MFIGKMFGKYNIDFPVENDLNILIGMNGSGKTQTLYLLKDYFEKQGENVVYLPTDRQLMIDEDDMLKLDVAQALIGRVPLRQALEVRYDMKDPFAFEFTKKGEYINGGYLQIMNMFYYIAMQPEDSIVMIDLIERSLHILVQRHLIRDLLASFKIKKLIITTHSPEIISNFDKSSIVEVEKLVQL